jgi:Tfp pilus assembly protein FimT
MMQYAKSEAVKRNATVSLCAGDTTNGCVCNAQAGCDANWRNGYIVFNDPNSNCIVNNGEQILRVVNEGIRGDYTITAIGCLTFMGLGNLSTNNTVTIRVCTSNITTDNIMNIQVNPVGRPRVQKSTGTCGGP